MSVVKDLRLAGLVPLCLVMAACGQADAPPPVVDEDDTSAKGEVLEGTISDRMIPYDEIGRGDAPSMAGPMTPAGEPAEPAAPAAAAARPAAPQGRGGQPRPPQADDAPDSPAVDAPAPEPEE
ncbi:hypothetical protein [Porphyrobacter sp. GA68]|uniref:hypothetical protein n=1 Tax=Porphyrobacter sp. GA68 TaxID=2883480 RepID=UPI001D1915B4|nr:hypothetical protein [Porphyrobacter sp. GA68]